MDLLTIAVLCCTLESAGIECPAENLENAEVREKAALCLNKSELPLLFMAEAIGITLSIVHRERPNVDNTQAPLLGSTSHIQKKGPHVNIDVDQ